MKINNKQIQKYNRLETLVMISLYPNKGEVYSLGKSGVASYAKNLSIQMNRPVVVLTDFDQQPQKYEELNTLVLRCFKTNNPLLWVQLLVALKKFNLVKNVLIQFDFSIYGSYFTSALIIPFIALLRILGYNTYIINHHVVSDIKKLSGHIGLGNNFKDQVKAFLYNLIFHNFYRLLGLFSNKIVVLEEPLRKRLNTYINSKKTVTIPHAVDNNLLSKNKQLARKKLKISQKDQVVMFFGYLNWFKGADIFAEAFGKTSQLLGKKTRFIMAGGKSPTLKNKTYYQKYYQKVFLKTKQSAAVKITGYIPQNKIADYFAACDLVVFPYREFMCASGVLSLVFSYQKPFLLSDNLSKMLEQKDFSEALNSSLLKNNDLTFKLDNHQDLIESAEKILSNGLKIKMKKMARIMKSKRSFENNALQYENLIFQPTYLPQPSLHLNYN